jgi:hypothetical protein
MQIILKKTFFLLILSVGLAACGGGSKKSLKKVQVNLVTAGPLFNGSNTATGIWNPELKASGKVHSARFTSVTVSCPDTTLAGFVGNLVLQIAAPKTEMKKIAFYKGAANGKQLKLQVADEQDDLRDFFNGQEITFVIDYDLLPDEFNGDLPLTVEFDAELTTD